jgi:PhoP regulatory network protein YrbL
MTKQCPIQNLEPIAAGKFRLVYEHPEDRNLLIKVIRPEMIERRWGSGTPWYKRQRRMGQYALFMREINEFLATCADDGQAPSFAQKITGLIETHLGLGLITEAARDREGKLAPPMKKLLAERRFGEEERAALDRFCEQLLRSNIVVADMHSGNIVYAYNESEGNHFVLIDGIGATTLIPLKVWSRRANLASKRSKIAKLRRSVEKYQ